MDTKNILDNYKTLMDLAFFDQTEAFLEYAIPYETPGTSCW